MTNRLTSSAGSFVILILVTIASTLPAKAQTPEIKKDSSPASRPYKKTDQAKDKTKTQQPENKKADSVPDLQTALDYLQSAADQLKDISETEERLKVAGDLVKLLASRDPRRCRRMLDFLFDEALAAKETRSEGKDAPFDQHSAIKTIINIAAGFDRKLAEAYVDKYTEENDKAKEAQTGNLVGRELYVKIATSLIEKDPALAVSVAKRGISAVDYDVLTFLGTLRKKDVKLASGFFADILQSVSARPVYNINEMVVLYTYLFSPLRVPYVSQRGIQIMHISGYAQVAENYPVDSLLAKQYLQVAARMLSNTERYGAGQVERLTEGITGDFYFAGMALPHAAIYSPEAEEAISAARNFLRHNLQSDLGAQPEAALDRWNNLRANPGAESSKALGSVDYYLQQAERATDVNQKDRLYNFAAKAAVSEKKYELAIEIADKVSEARRNQAKNSITYQIALQFAQAGEYLKAEEMARKDEDLARRAYVLTSVALSFVEGKNKDEARAIEYLTEIEQLATKIDSLKERISVLFGAAEVFARFDRIRAYEVLREGIKTANNVKDFTGSTHITRTLDTGGFYFMTQMYDDKFSFFTLIDRLAGQDFNETLLQVQELKEPLPRIRANIMACKKVFSKE